MGKKKTIKNQINKVRTHNTVHIAGRGSVVRQLRILVSQFRVLRTGTLSEIPPDHIQVTVSKHFEQHSLTKINAY